jgi:hypothetical protein
MVADEREAALSGVQMLHGLDDALRDVRREEDELARRLARNVELTIKLRQTEGELMRRLAAGALEPEVRAALSGSLTQAEVEARTVLERHGTELEAAQQALSALDQRIAALDAERAELRSTADKAQRRLDAIAERLDAAPAEGNSRVAVREGATRARRMAMDVQHKMRQADADRELKGRPFRDDRLFMYLWERGYGTDAYRGGALTARLDAWVASMIGYEKARRTFAMLAEIPARLASHAEALRQQADEAEAELRRLERGAVDEAGGRADREALEQAGVRIAEIDAEVVLLEDERDEAARRRRELAQGSEPPLSSAFAALADALGREDVRTLLRQGRTSGDIGLVRQIDELRGRASDEESDARDLRARLRTLATRRRELEDIRYEFKRQGFDESRSGFGEARLASEMLNDFLRGGIGAAEYWGRIRRSQKWSEGGATRTRQGFGWLWGKRVGDGSAAAETSEPASHTPDPAEFSRPRGAAAGG